MTSCITSFWNAAESDFVLGEFFRLLEMCQ